MATMECMRDIGLEHECRRNGLEWSSMSTVHWDESMSGKEFARLPAWGNGPSEARYRGASPCTPIDLAQTLLEPILVQKAATTGFTVRFDTEFLSFSEVKPQNAVLVRVRDLVFNKEYTVQCKYLFGCDGAHSLVLQQLKIPVLRGKGAGIKSWDLLVRVDLSHTMQFRRGNLHWTFQDDHLHPGRLLVAHPRVYKPWNEWVVGFSWAPGAAPESEMVPTHEDWSRRLKKMVGDDSIVPEILDIFTWEMDNAVAQHSSEGRVFCLGDAVHRHGPGGALGSNTAIQDAYNIAWKIAYVLKGQAGPGLLDSYSTERNPVGAQAASSSMDAIFANMAIWEALGVLGGCAKAVREQQSKLAENSDEGRSLRKSLRKVLENSKFGIEGLGIEMNQHYQSSAIWLRDESEPQDLSDSRLLYHKTTFPGSRLPHAWLNTAIPTRPISTIDLAGHGRFTIFTGIGGEQWKICAPKVAAALGLSIAVFSIGHGQDYEDPAFEWEAHREIDECGAVLVRPDRFIAWRCKEVPEGCEATLLTVLKEILSA
ncbi:hypothetical protein N7532_008266 [Penicillium argentinense]|uniref:FAD-binding domain-containing protein n=1 Tax=Penicillium argentinense TaxID=1131581 RepID=A0A9W9K2C4_9EURO|nr:uncharacterized protein N7532_008266 [Penicillium argentinense]KAJ5089582.1 hypothetical protein N7532_008266 [Penicillium argentinense]